MSVYIQKHMHANIPKATRFNTARPRTPNYHHVCNIFVGKSVQDYIHTYIQTHVFSATPVRVSRRLMTIMCEASLCAKQYNRLHFFEHIHAHILVSLLMHMRWQP